MKQELLRQLQAATTLQTDLLRTLRSGACTDPASLRQAAEALFAIKACAKALFASQEQSLDEEERILKEDLHAITGNAHAATRLYLENSSAITLPAVYETWDLVLDLIKTGVHRNAHTDDAAASLLQAARAAGIRLTLATPLPADNISLRAFMKDASAALLKAAREGKTELTL